MNNSDQPGTTTPTPSAAPVVEEQWQKILQIIFEVHEKYLPKEPLDHEQSEVYMYMAKRVAAMAGTPSSPIDVEQEAKEYADKENPLKEFYQSNFARGLKEECHASIIKGFKAGWEARQGEAVEFAEWISDNQFACYNEIWTSTKIHYLNEAYNTSQLYQLFLTPKNK